MPASQAPLELTPDLLIGRGTHRACYEHPGNRDRCVKIVVSDAIPREQQRAVDRELRLYRQLQGRNIDWTLLARYFGEVHTSQGLGYEYELIRDFDGQVSQPLETWLKKSPPPPPSALVPALANLHDYLQDNRILTTELHESNMVWQRSNQRDGRLVIIDDIGNADYIPIRDIWPLLARNKIRRKWQRFAARLSAQYSIHPL